MLRRIAILLGCAALLPAANADLILHNGKIVTVDSRFTIQQAVAIRSGVITAVGPDSAVLKAERGSEPRSSISTVGQCFLAWWMRMFTRSKPA